MTYAGAAGTVNEPCDMASQCALEKVYVSNHSSVIKTAGKAHLVAP